MKVNVIKIEAKCEQGHIRRDQLLNYSQEQAEMFCDFMNTHERSIIGKCEICQKPLKCTIIEYQQEIRA